MFEPNPSPEKNVMVESIIERIHRCAEARQKIDDAFLLSFGQKTKLISNLVHKAEEVFDLGEIKKAKAIKTDASRLTAEITDPNSQVTGLLEIASCEHHFHDDNLSIFYLTRANEITDKEIQTPQEKAKQKILIAGKTRDAGQDPSSLVDEALKIADDLGQDQKIELVEIIVGQGFSKQAIELLDGISAEEIPDKIIELLIVNGETEYVMGFVNNKEASDQITIAGMLAKSGYIREAKIVHESMSEESNVIAWKKCTPFYIAYCLYESDHKQEAKSFLKNIDLGEEAIYKNHNGTNYLPLLDLIDGDEEIIDLLFPITTKLNLHSKQKIISAISRNASIEFTLDYVERLALDTDDHDSIYAHLFHEVCQEAGKFSDTEQQDRVLAHCATIAQKEDNPLQKTFLLNSVASAYIALGDSQKAKLLIESYVDVQNQSPESAYRPLYYSPLFELKEKELKSCFWGDYYAVDSKYLQTVGERGYIGIAKNLIILGENTRAKDTAIKYLDSLRTYESTSAISPHEKAEQLAIIAGILNQTGDRDIADKLIAETCTLVSHIEDRDDQMVACILLVKAGYPKEALKLISDLTIEDSMTGELIQAFREIHHLEMALPYIEISDQYNLNFLIDLYGPKFFLDLVPYANSGEKMDEFIYILLNSNYPLEALEVLNVMQNRELISYYLSNQDKLDFICSQLCDGGYIDKALALAKQISDLHAVEIIADRQLESKRDFFVSQYFNLIGSENDVSAEDYAILEKSSVRPIEQLLTDLRILENYRFNWYQSKLAEKELELLAEKTYRYSSYNITRLYREVIGEPPLGIDMERLTQDWLKSGPEKLRGYIVYANLKQIYCLDTVYPGSVSYLSGPNTFNISCFARYPLEMLADQYLQKDSPTPSIFLLGEVSDSNGTHMQRLLVWQGLYQAVKERNKTFPNKPIYLRVAEADSRFGVSKRLTTMKKRYGENLIEGLVIETHGSEIEINFGIERITIDDFITGTTQVLKTQYYKPKMPIVFIGCSTGAQDGIAQKASGIMESSTTGPKIPASPQYINPLFDNKGNLIDFYVKYNESGDITTKYIAGMPQTSQTPVN